MQIIVYMDMNPDQFRSNCSIREENPRRKESRYEFIFAGTKDIPGIPDKDDITRNPPIILTDRPEVCTVAAKRGICCIGLERSGEKLTGAWCCLQPPFELDLSWLEMQMCHFYDIPYVLYEENGIRIRESRDADLPYVSGILQEMSLHVEGFFENIGMAADDEIFREASCADPEARRNTFDAYTTQLYRMWGFGMWTVEKYESSSLPRVIGWCGFFPTRLPEGGVEMGYVIAQEEQGKGIGYRVCSKLLSFAEEHLEIYPIYLRTSKKNAGSMKLARKLGFVKIREEGGDCIYTFMTQ